MLSKPCSFAYLKIKQTRGQWMNLVYRKVKGMWYKNRGISNKKAWYRPSLYQLKWRLGTVRPLISNRSSRVAATSFHLGHGASALSLWCAANRYTAAVNDSLGIVAWKPWSGMESIDRSGGDFDPTYAKKSAGTKGFHRVTATLNRTRLVGGKHTGRRHRPGKMYRRTAIKGA